MIWGLGTDLVELRAFGQQLADGASTFEASVFTPGELRAAQLRPSQDKTRHLAARYAAKEAFVKAWSGACFGQAPQLSRVELRHVEVISDAFGRPALRLHESLARRLPAGHRLLVSMSHDGDYATATVLITLAGA